jgi:hypothetical protein
VRSTARAIGARVVGYFDRRFAELQTRVEPLDTLDHRFDRIDLRLDEVVARLVQIEERTGVDAATVVELLTTPDRTPAPLAPPGTPAA